MYGEGEEGRTEHPDSDMDDFHKRQKRNSKLANYDKKKIKEYADDVKNRPVMYTEREVKSFVYKAMLQGKLNGQPSHRRKIGLKEFWDKNRKK